MWKAAFTGRSEKGGSSSTAGGGAAAGGGGSEGVSRSSSQRNKKSTRDSASAVSATPSRKSSTGDRSRREKSSRSSRAGGDDEDNDARSSSYVTAPSSRAGGGLTERAVHSLDDDEEDDWEDEDTRTERKSSRSATTAKRAKRSSTSDRRDSERRDTDDRRARKDSSSSRRSRGNTDNRETERGIPEMGSFEQFPGQYSDGRMGPPPPSSSQEHTMSGALPSTMEEQFPGQRMGPTRADSYGAAADYYLDEGQSVQHQPGVRPLTPNMLVNPDTHLMAASAEAHPAADTGHGSAADFYSGNVIYEEPESITPANKPGKHSSSGSNGASKPSRRSSSLGSAAVAVAAAGLGSLASGLHHHKQSSTQNVSSTSTSSYQQNGNVSQSNRPEKPSRHSSGPVSPRMGPSGSYSSTPFGQQGSRPPYAQSGSAPSGQQGYRPPYPQNSSTPSGQQGSRPPYAQNGSNPSTPGRKPQSSNTNNNAGLYAAGAAAAAGLAGYEMYEHSNQHNTQNGSTFSIPPPSYTPQRPPRPYSGAETQQTFTEEETIHTSNHHEDHYHEHRSPISRLKTGFFNLISTKEDTARMEEYTEYIGVCKYCFDPRSSPRDGPREHHFHRPGSPHRRDSFESLRRRRSAEKLAQLRRRKQRSGSRERVDKESRYTGKSGRGNDLIEAGLAAAGMAGAAGLAGSGAARRRDDFSEDNLDTLKTGHRASSARRRRSRSSSREKRLRDSNGTVRRDESRGEFVTVRTKDGRLERRRVQRSPARSEQDRKTGSSGLLGAAAAAGAVLGGGAVLADESKHRREDGGAWVRRRSRSHSPRQNGGFFGGSNTPQYGVSQPPHGQQRPGSRSSSEGETGFFGSFFSPPRRQSSKRGRRPTRQSKPINGGGGFFGFGAGDSGSESDLAFGGGEAFSSSRTPLPLRRKNSSRLSAKSSRTGLRKKKSDEHFAATLAGLGATATALAAYQRGNRVSKPGQRAELGARKNVQGHRVSGGRDSRHAGSAAAVRDSSEEEEGWEDELPTDVDDESSAGSDLAFGDYEHRRLSKRQSMDSVGSHGSSNAGGLGAWGWRWGGKDRKRQQRPAGASTSQPFVPPQRPPPQYRQNDVSLGEAIAGGMAAGAIGSAATNASGRTPSSTSSVPQPPMQHIDPRPMSETSSRHASSSMPGAFDSSVPVVRPGPGPIQQPQPVTPIKTAFAADTDFDHRPTPKRAQSSPTQRTTNHNSSSILQDVALAGAAAVGAGIIASQSSSASRRKSKDANNVRFGFTEEQHAKHERELREEQARTEEARRKAAELQALKDEAERHSREQEVLRARAEENRRKAERELERQREVEREEAAQRAEAVRLRERENARREEEAAREQERIMEEARRRQDEYRREQARLQDEARRREDERRREQAAAAERAQQEAYERDRVRREQAEAAERAQQEAYERDRARREQADAADRAQQEAYERDRARRDRSGSIKRERRSPSSGVSWSDVAAGSIAAATVGAVAAGVAHESRDKSRESSTRRQESYDAKIVTPSEEAMNRPLSDNDNFGYTAENFIPRRGSSPSSRDNYENYSRRAEEFARRAADRVTAERILEEQNQKYSQPAQSQAEFFAPKELLSQKAEGKTKNSDPIGVGNEDLVVYHANDDITPAQLPPELLRKHAPFGVPRLALIPPTPPPQVTKQRVRDARSRSRSPLSSEDERVQEEKGERDVEREKEAQSQQRKSSERSKRISWGQDRTHVYDAQTPESFDERGRTSYVEDHDVSTATKEVAAATGVAAAAAVGVAAYEGSHKKDEKKEDTSKKAAFEDDVEEVEDVKDDGRGEQQGFYRQPFYESVSDIGISPFQVDSPGTEGAPPVQGFVEEGEVDELEPAEESQPHVPGGWDDQEPTVKASEDGSSREFSFSKREDLEESRPAISPRESEQVEDGPAWEPPLSKKEQKKRGKQAKKSSGGGFADIAMAAMTSQPAATKATEGEATAATIETAAPEDPWEPPLSKKEKKKREKAAKRASVVSGTFDAAPSAPLEEEEDQGVAPPRTQTDEAAWEPPLSKKEKKKLEKQAKKQGFADVAEMLLAGGGAAAASGAAVNAPRDEESESSDSRKVEKERKSVQDHDQSGFTASVEQRETSEMPGSWDDRREDQPTPVVEMPDPFQYQIHDRPSPPATAENEVDPLSEFAETKKSKKKKKRDSQRFSEPGISSPLRGEFSREEADSQPQKDRTAELAAAGVLGGVASAAAAEAFTAEPEEIGEERSYHGSSARDAESSRPFAAKERQDEYPEKRHSPDDRYRRDDEDQEERVAYDDRPPEARPDTSDTESSRKSKRRSRTYADDEDAASAVSSRSRRDKEDTSSSSSKKDKIGGFFGMFSRKSSEPNVSKSSKDDGAPLSRTSTRDSRDDNEAEGDSERRHRHRSHRGSEYGDNDDARSVVSSSSRRRHSSRYDDYNDDEDDPERRHRHHHDDDDGHERRHHHRRDTGDDEYARSRSRAGSEAGSRHHHRRHTGDEDHARSRSRAGSEAGPRHHHRRRTDEDSYERDQSFLESRVEDLPPLPDSPPTSPVSAPVNQEQDSGKPGSDDVDDSESPRAHEQDVERQISFAQPTFESLQEEVHPDELPALPESRPLSPTALAGLEAVARPPTLQRPTSTNSIPRRFPIDTNPATPSPRMERAISFTSPVQYSPTTSSAQKTRQSRPASGEIRPLYLVERNRKTPDVESSLPSLPSSKPSSRASSQVGSEEYESAVEDQGSPTQRHRHLSIDTSQQLPMAPFQTHEDDYLDSQQTTPKATHFPEDIHSKAPKQEPQFYTWEDFMRDERRHSVADVDYGGSLQAPGYEGEAHKDPRETLNEADSSQSAGDYATEEVPSLSPSKSVFEAHGHGGADSVVGATAGATALGAAALLANKTGQNRPKQVESTGKTEAVESTKDGPSRDFEADAPGSAAFESPPLFRTSSKKKKGKKGKKSKQSTQDEMPEELQMQEEPPKGEAAPLEVVASLETGLFIDTERYLEEDHESRHQILEDRAARPEPTSPNALAAVVDSKRSMEESELSQPLSMADDDRTMQFTESKGEDFMAAERAMEEGAAPKHQITAHSETFDEAPRVQEERGKPEHSDPTDDSGDLALNTSTASIGFFESERKIEEGNGSQPAAAVDQDNTALARSPSNTIARFMDSEKMMEEGSASGRLGDDEVVSKQKLNALDEFLQIEGDLEAGGKGTMEAQDSKGPYHEQSADDFPPKLTRKLSKKDKKRRQSAAAAAATAAAFEKSDVAESMKHEGNYMINHGPNADLPAKTTSRHIPKTNHSEAVSNTEPQTLIDDTMKASEGTDSNALAPNAPLEITPASTTVEADPEDVFGGFAPINRKKSKKNKKRRQRLEEEEQQQEIEASSQQATSLAMDESRTADEPSPAEAQLRDALQTSSSAASVTQTPRDERLSSKMGALLTALAPEDVALPDVDEDDLEEPVGVDHPATLYHHGPENEMNDDIPWYEGEGSNLELEMGDPDNAEGIVTTDTVDLPAQDTQPDDLADPDPFTWTNSSKKKGKKGKKAKNSVSEPESLTRDATQEVSQIAHPTEALPLLEPEGRQHEPESLLERPGALSDQRSTSTAAFDYHSRWVPEPPLDAEEQRSLEAIDTSPPINHDAAHEPREEISPGDAKETSHEQTPIEKSAAEEILVEQAVESEETQTPDFEWTTKPARKKGKKGNKSSVGPSLEQIASDSTTRSLDDTALPLPNQEAFASDSQVVSVPENTDAKRNENQAQNLWEETSSKKKKKSKKNRGSVAPDETPFQNSAVSESDIKDAQVADKGLFEEPASLEEEKPDPAPENETAEPAGDMWELSTPNKKKGQKGKRATFQSFSFEDEPSELSGADAAKSLQIDANTAPSAVAVDESKDLDVGVQRPPTPDSKRLEQPEERKQELEFTSTFMPLVPQQQERATESDQPALSEGVEGIDRALQPSENATDAGDERAATFGEEPEADALWAFQSKKKKGKKNKKSAGFIFQGHEGEAGSREAAQQGRNAFWPPADKPAALGMPSSSRLDVDDIEPTRDLTTAPAPSDEVVTQGPNDDAEESRATESLGPNEQEFETSEQHVTRPLEDAPGVSPLATFDNLNDALSTQQFEPERSFTLDERGEGHIELTSERTQEPTPDAIDEMSSRQEESSILPLTEPEAQSATPHHSNDSDGQATDAVDQELEDLFPVKQSKKDKKKAKKARSSVVDMPAEESIAASAGLAEPAPASTITNDKTHTLDGGLVAIAAVAGAALSEKTDTQGNDEWSGFTRKKSKKGKKSRSSTVDPWTDEPNPPEEALVPAATSAGESTEQIQENTPDITRTIPSDQTDVSGIDEQVEGSPWAAFTTKKSKKEKRKSKKIGSDALDVEQSVSATEPSEPAAEIERAKEHDDATRVPTEDSEHKATEPPGLDIPTRTEQESVEQEQVLEASDEASGRTREPQPKNYSQHDIDFTATVAAGLADSGFNAAMVVNDPVFQRRSSPPGAVGEADPEETFSTVTKKKKGKKGKRGIQDNEQFSSAPASESEPLQEPPPNDFDEAIAQSLTGSGFDAALLQQATSSSNDVSTNELSGEAGISFADSKRKKGKKTKRSPVSAWTNWDETGTTEPEVEAEPSFAEHDDAEHISEEQEPNAAIDAEQRGLDMTENIATSGDTTESGSRSKSEFEDPANAIVVAGDRDLDIDEMEQSYRAYRKKKRNQKKEEAAAESARRAEIEGNNREGQSRGRAEAEQPIESVKDVDDSSATGAKQVLDESTVAVRQNESQDEPEDDRTLSEVSASRVRSVFPNMERVKRRTPPLRSSTEEAKPSAERSGTSKDQSSSNDIGMEAAAVAAAGAGLNLGQSIARSHSRHHDRSASPSLHGKRSLGLLPGDHGQHDQSHEDWSFSALDDAQNTESEEKTRDMIRDSGYEVAADSHRGQVDTTSPISDGKVSEGSDERGRTPSLKTDDTPLQSASKQRTSYLFQTPPGQETTVDQEASPLLDPPTPSQKSDAPDYFLTESRRASETSRDMTRPGQTANTDRGIPASRAGGPLSPGETLGTILEERHAPKHTITHTDAEEPFHKTRRRSVTPQSIREREQAISPTLSRPVTSGGSDVRSVSSPLWGLNDPTRPSWVSAVDDGNAMPPERARSARPPEDFRSQSVMSSRSNNSAGLFRNAADLRSFSRASNRSSTPTLRRSSMSGDLRAASLRGDAGSAVGARASPKTIPFEAPPTPPPNEDEDDFDAGASRSVAMSDVYSGFGDAQGSQVSPTRPPSMRKRQSMHVMELESRVDQLVAENQALHDARQRRGGSPSIGPEASELHEALATRDLQLREKDSQISQIRAMLQPMQQEIARLTEINGGLTDANKNLVDDTNGRYATLQQEYAHAHEQWQSASKELAGMREEHGRLTSGMREAVDAEIAMALADKNTEIRRLREELDVATEQIRALQVQIQSSKKNDFLLVRDEDYFDGACQKLCQHVQQWVLRFSKLSDDRICRPSTEMNDDKIEARLDNAILDGSDVDKLLNDRVRRRDVFMSVVMTMVWEYVFTRYLFGMDREQRQKLKALEKLLSEVGPARAVAQWRATTLTLLSKRPGFTEQRDLDTEAVATEVFALLCALLPPPSNAETQLMTSLQKVIGIAADLSIEMRTQRAEYIMLPPLQPEYDTNGDLVRQVHFNASLMNERSGVFGSNGELEQSRAVVKIVLFPLVVKKGDEFGEGEEEIVVCPAQVLVQNESGRSKKIVRVQSGAMEIDDPRRSRQSLTSTFAGSTAY